MIMCGCCCENISLNPLSAVTECMKEVMHIQLASANLAVIEKSFASAEDISFYFTDILMTVSSA